MSAAAVLQAKNITKTYGRVVALDGADLELFPGEVLAVIGDNGAGKSTLIKCLSGAETPDTGSIEIDGQTVLLKRPQDGREAGAKEHISALGIGTIQNMSQAVETLSGGQRQAVAVARAAAFGQRLIIMDEPTAALGVRESNQVLKLIESLRERGMPVILISHNMPQVFEVADRIQVMRLGKRAAVVTPKTHDMKDAVAIMTGAVKVDAKDQTLKSVR